MLRRAMFYFLAWLLVGGAFSYAALDSMSR